MFNDLKQPHFASFLSYYVLFNIKYIFITLFGLNRLLLLLLLFKGSSQKIYLAKLCPGK